MILNSNGILIDQKISVAVPLRSNINKEFQSCSDEFIATPPTPHTLSGKGNIAGWHFTKEVPISFNNVYSFCPTDSDTTMALAIADTFKHDEFIKKAKELVKRIESGESVFGAIDFDEALRKLSELDNSSK